MSTAMMMEEGENNIDTAKNNDNGEGDEASHHQSQPASSSLDSIMQYGSQSAEESSPAAATKNQPPELSYDDDTSSSLKMPPVSTTTTNGNSSKMNPNAMSHSANDHQNSPPTTNDKDATNSNNNEEEDDDDTNNNNENTRQQTSDKSPRTENNWLRSSPTSIGDGYIKIINDLQLVHTLLLLSNMNKVNEGYKFGSDNKGEGGESNQNNNNTSSSSSTVGEIITSVIGEKNNKISIQQRLNELKDTKIKLLKESQLKKTLLNDYDIPRDVDAEIDLVEEILLSTTSASASSSSAAAAAVDGEKSNDSSNGGDTNIQKVKEILTNIKTFASELSTILKEIIQSNQQKMDEGDMSMRSPRFKTTEIVNGRNKGGPNMMNVKGGDGRSSFAEGSGKRQQQQQQQQQRVTTTSRQLEYHEELYNQIQFLSSESRNNTTSSSTTTIDYNKKVTFDGTIVDRIETVPHGEGVAGLQNLLDGMSSNSTTNNSNIASAASVSGEAMNGMFPTMAPPMTSSIHDPYGAYSSSADNFDLESSILSSSKKGRGRPRKEKKKKGSKKRGRDRISNETSSLGGSDTTGQPKRKRTRGKKNVGDMSTDDDDDEVTYMPGMMKPPPPSTTGLPPSPGRIVVPAKSHGLVRTIPDFTPVPNTEYTIVTDANPNRICNPLLRLPQFPDGKDPPVSDVPQGGELWNISDLHYYDGDTYPVSYLARLLGFDVSSVATYDDEFGSSDFDVMKIGRNDEENNVLDVPDRGSFCDQVWKKGARSGTSSASLSAAAVTSSNGMADDLNLTYSDPLWANILSSYKGYNEDDFKDAGKGFLDDLSEHCLEYAMERGVILGKQTKDTSAAASGKLKNDEANIDQSKNDSGMRFRFGTVEDEQTLSLLAEKCQWKSHPRHDLATCLRSQSHFCIVAELPHSSSDSSASDANKGARRPIAFLQYRFCWYGVEEKKVGNVSTEKISELVIFIDNLVYDDSSCITGVDNSEAKETTTTSVSPKDLETAKVLLTSLALVHAAREGIWYGMMESPTTLVPFFSKYFRMSSVMREEGKSDDSDETMSPTIPLVLDIKKCHFKYAILLLEDSLKEQTCQLRKDDAIRERMIVHLSKSEAANPTQETAPTVFSNSDKAQLKKAHIRLVGEPHNVELFSVSASTGENEGETKEVLNSIGSSSLDASTADWNVIKSFPLGDIETVAQKGTGKTEESESSDVSDDLFLTELKKKQAELLALESSIETTSRDILAKAYNEHSAYLEGKQKRELDKKKIEDYQAVQRRLHEAELAWQAQLDQDMDAVCDVCFDGEVTPDNQIIFCDACNVAVHQRCYGIDQIPTGNYFCHTCTHFEVDKEYLAARRRDGPPMKLTRHPIICELCPRRQGAFVQVETPLPTKKAKWVHVGCAKWQGMNYVDVELKDKIEDLTALKDYFRFQGVTCSLCKSSIGALHKCREEGCDKWMHLTCARSVGKCSVQHGENCEGFYDPDAIDHPPWTLACPKHSEVDPESVKDVNILTTDQLVKIAESYPPEPVPPKPFYKMNATERKEYWSDPQNLTEFFEKVTTSLSGVKCTLCEVIADPNIDQRCDKCGVFSHADCSDPTRGDRATCLTCRYNEDHANDKFYEEPRCHMCQHPNESCGPLVRAHAKPVSMKKWKPNSLSFQRSTFGKNKFVHGLCGMWNPLCSTGLNKDNELLINCSETAMSNGKEHVSHQFRCNLCGLTSGAKVDCCVEGCVHPGGRKLPCKFHVTCAKQAGLDVQICGEDFFVKCFDHAECAYNLRARLEDLKELEIQRFSGKQFKSTLPMSWNHASILYNSAVNILRTLGWAWRWAEWWVASGDNWEPLLEDGEVEEEMTEEELKIVHSDPESRCRDARQCRLAAFGAALRNRDYDKEDGDDQEPLERALTAIMSTKSLVGPLKKKEIEFFVTWLALAYRSKSPILGFGKDKAAVADDLFCVHQHDGTPKYELGSRPLPGKVAPERGVFEPVVEEVDDFLKIPLSASPARHKKQSKKRKSEEPPPPDSGSGASLDLTDDT